ncbi:MAG TPA: DUF2304 domain-containing protein [Bryobacteraceae bacterium]|jgi:hypothetical protein
MRFESLFLATGIFTTIATLRSLRREHIRTEYSISWLGVGVILTLLALFADAISQAAHKIGLDPAICFAAVAAMLISGLVFEISHVVSRLRDENVILTQRLAILEHQVRKVDSRHGETID